VKDGALFHVWYNIFGNLEVNEKWSSFEYFIDSEFVGSIDFFFNAQLQLKEFAAHFLYVIKR